MYPRLLEVFGLDEQTVLGSTQPLLWSLVIVVIVVFGVAALALGGRHRRRTPECNALPERAAVDAGRPR